MKPLFNQIVFLSLLVFLIAFAGKASETKISIVERFGLIHVKGNQIVDKHENPVALHGMSLFWSQWGGKYYNEDCIRWLYDDWNCTIIRAAMGVEEGGYLTNPDKEYNNVTNVIDACIKLGIYVIVDWHDHHAEKHPEAAIEFFGKIAQKYGHAPNIIYEIYNEPLKVSWSNVLKPYSESVIKEIRKYDSDNLILAGTSVWAQEVDSASLNPIKDKNIAYTLHFYSSTHKEVLREKGYVAMKNSAAIFISEFGISEANGNGIINPIGREEWLAFIDSLALSSCNWSIIDKDETSAALKPGAASKGNWSESDLSESGKFIRNRIRTLNRRYFSH